ncbi:putative transporter [Oscillibacter valericigenes Sjm18-20]|nr:putative transporter [Oscillibacter valericigenes Sjm18-20]
MKKFLSLLLACLMIPTFVSGCGSTSGTASSSASTSSASSSGSEQPVNLVFSTQASSDVNYVKAIYMVKDEIEKESNGSLTMEIHDNGSLMTQEGEVDAVARGTLDMMFSSPFLIADQLPYLSMFTAAYIFKDEAHLREVMDGEIGQKVVEDVADKLNVRWLSALYCGSRNLDLRDIGHEVKTPEDLKGVNLRMPNSTAWLFMGKALGANPTPMAFAEVYQGLQTGAIDGQENPLPTTVAQKWYEVTNQIVLTGHVIEPMCIAICEDKWQSLSDNQKTILTNAIKTATEWCDQENLEEEQKDIEFLREQGLTIVEPDLDAFMEYSENYYLSNSEMTADWDMYLYQQIKSL